MKENLNFLIEINRLKEIPRTWQITWRVKNPTTIADHIFRATFTIWLLGQKKNLNIKKLIKIALAHDLCEVYAGDLTPLFYYQKRTPKIMKWFRLSEKEKKKRAKKQLEIEKNSLLKLVKHLNSEVQREIVSSWFDYEQKISQEGKFAKQADRIDTLLESIEEIGTDEQIAGKSWWEGTEEIVEDSLLWDYLKVIQNKFYQRKFKNVKNEKEMENILDFLLEIGKLKRMPRLYWTLRGIKNPESVAGHIFTLAIMAWIFGRERKELHQEKLLKMALCHELSAVYTGDTTPYDRILPKDEKEREEVLKKMIRLSKKEKKWIFLTDYKKEKKAIEKLTKKIDPSIKKEILELWHEYRTRSSPEAKFLGQLNILAVLLQGLFYEKEYKEFTAAPLWEWAFENCDDEICVSLMDEMKKKFYG